MKSSSRWQGIRDEFARIARIEKVAVYPSEPFTREQWKEFDEVLNNWNNYMNENKMSWFKERSHGLEYYFYDYIRGHPKACGAWGFILQQADWNRAVSYYSANPDPGATGKPYYLLKYYCNESRQGSIDELYTDEVNERGVSIFCPH
jgi:hypothetical protein